MHGAGHCQRRRQGAQGQLHLQCFTGGGAQAAPRLGHQQGYRPGVFEPVHYWTIRGLALFERQLGQQLGKVRGKAMQGFPGVVQE